MPNINLSDSSPEFEELVNKLLKKCSENNIEMNPYCVIRSPEEQAKIWRQSRKKEEIDSTIRDLKSNGAYFLSECIEAVGPQNGPHVTNALPGLSWHQWGEAVDCVWMVDGKAVWDTPRIDMTTVNGYGEYARIAKELGLTPGGYWRSFKDWPHVQLRPDSSPIHSYSLSEISKIMEHRFS